jgi:hypothetical protein
MGIKLGYSNDLFGSASFFDYSLSGGVGGCADASCTTTCHSCKEGCADGPSGTPVDPEK